MGCGRKNCLRHRGNHRNLRIRTRSCMGSDHSPYELLSILQVPPLITPIVLPYTLPYNPCRSLDPKPQTPCNYGSYPGPGLRAQASRGDSTLRQPPALPRCAAARPAQGFPYWAQKSRSCTCMEHSVTEIAWKMFIRLLGYYLEHVLCPTNGVPYWAFFCILKLQNYTQQETMYVLCSYKNLGLDDLVFSF